MFVPATRSLIAPMSLLVATFVAGCAEPHHSPRAARPAIAGSTTPVQMKVCSNDSTNNCVAVPIEPGTTAPLELDDASISPRLIFVNRVSPLPSDSFMIKMARLHDAMAKTAKVRIDTTDYTAGSVTELASAIVDSGWAAMIRSTGKPPLRTIRITTGRPALNTSLAAHAATHGPAVTAPMATEYAVLVALSPDALDENTGVEYYFLAARPNEDCSLDLTVRDGASSPRLLLKSGSYLRVDRSSPQNPTIKPFPSSKELPSMPAWLQKAIGDGSINGFKFSS